MKRWLTLGLVLGLAGCSPPVATPPADKPAADKPAVGKPAAEKKVSAMPDIGDVIAQRPVLEAGRRAATTIRKAAQTENQQLKEIEAP